MIEDQVRNDRNRECSREHQRLPKARLRVRRRRTLLRGRENACLEFGGERRAGFVHDDLRPGASMPVFALIAASARWRAIETAVTVVPRTSEASARLRPWRRTSS